MTPACVVDHWHIDHIALAEMGTNQRVRTIPVSEVRGPDAKASPRALANLSRVDNDYVITRPAEHMHVDVDARARDEQRTRLLAAEGYYIEWMRREWLENGDARVFEPGNEAIMAALDLWKPRRDTMRAPFEATRIRVR